MTICCGDIFALRQPNKVISVDFTFSEDNNNNNNNNNNDKKNPHQNLL